MDVRECRGSVSVLRAVELLGVSKPGYYKWLHNRDKKPGEESDLLLRGEIQRIALDYPRYGPRRIKVELDNRGYRAGFKKVLRLMRMDNLLCVRKRYRLCTTDSNHGMPVYENLAKDLSVTGINHWKTSSGSSTKRTTKNDSTRR